MKLTFPVNNFEFLIASDNDAGEIATLRVFTTSSGTAAADSFAVVGNANITDPIPIDLSAHADVTRVEVINITDEFGLSYDDLSFRTDPVPEPATLVTLAMGAIGMLARRKHE